MERDAPPAGVRSRASSHGTGRWYSPRGIGWVEWTVLVLSLAFPVVVAALILPQLVGMGAAGARMAPARPLLGAPLGTGRVKPQTVEPPPALNPPARSPDEGEEHDAVRVTEAVHPDVTQPIQTYTVQRGDELRHIAEDHGVSVSSVLSLNEVPDPDSLRVGQVLRLPIRP